jgi:pantetheine-phosphate adenylyltransferase
MKKCLSHLSNITVQASRGLLVDIANECGADAVGRGLRSEADFPIESEMARLNRHMKGVETVFLIASPAVAHISAGWVRQIGRLGGNLSELVPESIRVAVEKGFAG